MASKNSLIKKYNAIKPARYSTLKELNISQRIPSREGESPEIIITLELMSEDEEKLILTFKGVRNLKLEQPSWSIFNIGFLGITSIQDRGWEKLHYEVIEAEEDSISFLCENFEFEIEKPQLSTPG